MSKKIPGNHKHLTLSDRIFIEKGLNDNLPFCEIARYLCKDPSTITNEVRKHITKAPSTRPSPVRNSCKFKKECREKNVCNNNACANKRCSVCNRCNKHCKRYKPDDCYKRLHRAPYVCNGCPSRQGCHEYKFYYNAVDAQNEYEKERTDSRIGINLTPDELTHLDNLVSPLVMMGQPIYHIYENNKDEIPVTSRTLYRYINDGVLGAKRMNLRRAVKYKKRYQSKDKENNIPKGARLGRDMTEFRKYIEDHIDDAANIVQMDTVMGKQGSKQSLLTLYFNNCHLQLIFILEEHTSQNVCDVFDFLEMVLGTEMFKKAFPVIITDNGPEFSNPVYLERASDGSRRTRIFYCDPYRSCQKAECEKNHEYIRYVIPKGLSMDDYTQSDMNLLMSHISSTSREALHGSCPYEMALIFLGKEFLDKLHIQKIASNDVNLTPKLLKENTNENV